MGAVIGIVIYAIIAYITCPRKENGSFEEGAVALYIIVPVVIWRFILYVIIRDKSMKKILYCILLMFLCSILSCDRKKQSSEQDMKDSLAAANFMKCAKFLYNTLFDDELKCFKPRIFIKYRQPVNGYDVTVICLPYNYTYDKERETEIWGNALLYFEKEDNRFYIYNESFSDSVLYYVNEQEVRDNMILELDYLPKSKNEYLSHNSPFFFSDVDFDGEEELIINNWRCGTRYCNTYDVYKITNNEAKRLIVEPFNKIESHAEFDSINKTIILNCYNGHRESYYKKYKQINKSTSYQFNLITIGQPGTDRKFTTLSDIDMGLKPKDFPDTPLIKELLDLYNSAIILYSLDHDFNLAECFDWNLKEIVNKLDCSIISNDTIREYAQNYKKSSYQYFQRYIL